MTKKKSTASKKPPARTKPKSKAAKSTKKDVIVEESQALSEDVTSSYDDVPYESYPYPQTHPQHLSALGKIFGLDTPDIENAKILELGCAAGGNIIPLAMDYPKAEFVGIDLSKEQIEKGQQQIKGLGLKNIKIQHKSIADINAKTGKFDFIICHGVFSWVPDDIAGKILDICSKNLTPNGLAIVSYNCLPGWSAVRSVRDMMLFHTKRFSEPHEKALQAKKLVEFLYQNSAENSPYKGILENERNVLNRTSSDYVLHEYLEDDNNPYYFHDFMTLADKNDLQYVADTNIATMFAGNLPKKAFDQLSALNNIIQQEQYMDFIRNRRFRNTILTHKKRNISRKILPENIENIYISCSLIPESDVAPNHDKVRFKAANGNMAVTVSAPTIKHLLKLLSEQSGKPMLVNDTISEAISFTKPDNAEETRLNIIDSIAQLILRGTIKIASEPENWVTEISEKPAVYPLALYQTSQPDVQWVTNAKRHKIRVNPITSLTLSLADGTRTVDNIVKEVATKAKERGIQVKKDKKVVTDPDLIKESLTKVVKSTLKEAAQKALLVA